LQNKKESEEKARKEVEEVGKIEELVIKEHIEEVENEITKEEVKAMLALQCC
jgi:hypothetical protein